MAGKKEYELLFKLKAVLGNDFNKSFQGAISTTKQLQGTLTKLNATQGKVEGYTRQTTAIEKNKLKLEDLNAEHDRLQKEISQTAEPSKALQREFDKTAGQIARTTTQIETQQSRLAGLGSELKAAGVNTDNLEAANQRLEKSYNAVKKSQENLATINAVQQKNKEAISQTKKELGGTIAIATAIGATIYAGPVKAAQGFQAQMSTVKAISGATGEDMKALGEKAKEMGIKTKFTAVESGKALEYMAMAGWKTGDMLSGIEGIMNLAAASGEDLALTSDIVTDALTAFGLKASDSAHFADVLAAASSNSNTNVAMMGESFKYAAPLAGAFNFSIEDTAVVLGLMANSGIKASSSGTALRKIFAGFSSDFEVLQADGAKYIVTTTNTDGTMRKLKDIIDDTRQAFNGMSEAEKKAAQTNLTETAKDLAIDLKNENGQLKTQAELYNDVTTAMDGLTAAGKVQEAESIAGKTAMAGLLTIVNASEEDYDKLTAAIENASGSAERMAAIRLENLDGDIELAKSAFEGLQLALGEALIPSATEGIKKVTELVTKLAQFANENPELTRTIVKVGSGLLAFKVATLGAKLGFLELKGGALAIGKVFELFRGKTAVAGAESIGLGARLKETGTGIKSYFNSVGGAMGGLFKGNIGGKIATIATSLKGTMGGALTLVGTKVGGLFGGIGKSITSGPLGKIGGMIGGQLNKAKNFIAPFTNVFTTAFAPLKGVMGGMFGGLGGVIGKVLPFVGVITAIIVAIQLVKKNLDKIREVVEKVFGAGGLAAFDKFIETVSKVGAAIKGIFSDGGIENIKGLIEDTFGENPALANFLNGFVTVFDSIQKVVGEFIGFVGEKITPVIQSVFDFIVRTVLPVIAQKFAEWGPTIGSIIEGLWVVIEKVAGLVIGIVSFLGPTIKEIVSATLDTIMGVISGGLNVIKGIVDIFSGVFTGSWTQVWEGVKTTFAGVWEAMKSIMKAPLNYMISGVNTLIRGLNKLTIPEWVPGVGGKGMNIPEIPGFEKGTSRTPNTFIAGERGPELITNAKNRTVFTAAQTGNIMGNINNARAQVAPRMQGIISAAGAALNFKGFAPQHQLAYAGAGAPQTIEPVRVSAAVAGKGTTTITVHNTPTIHVDGEVPGDLDEKLKRNNEELLNEIDEKMRKKDDDEGRGNYE